MKRTLTIVCLAAILSGCSVKEAPGGQETMPELTERIFSLAVTQAVYMDRHLGRNEFPRCLDGPDGRLVKSGSSWWCSGFFPGSLWEIYDYTRDDRILRLAKKNTAKLAGILEEETGHDIGFIVSCSYGNAWKLTGDESYLPLIEKSAEKLAGRFNQVTGTIRSWDGEWTKEKGWEYPVIIDNMMNLGLLMDAYRLFGTDSLRDIAVTHARTTMKNHFRPDFSTWHLVDYDPSDGSIRRKQTCQGYSDDSMWARGEAWAFYGYTMMYKRTGEHAFLDQAGKIASLLESKLPEDGIPYWDFDRDDYRDASAGAIMASAFIQLYEVTGRKEHLEEAEKILRTLAGPEYLSSTKGNRGFLLKHSVGSLPGNSEVDVPLTYADYYFLEALLCYRRATSHPRIFMNDTDFSAMEDRISRGDKILCRLDSLIFRCAESDDYEPFVRKLDASGKRILGISRKALRRIFINSYCFRRSGDGKYLERAERAMNNVCDFEDWNIKHFLDIAEMSAAVGIGYDWLYENLADSTREKVEEKMEQFAFLPSQDTVWAWFYRRSNNWNQVCNGGLALAALALREKSDTLAGNLIIKAVENNRPVVEAIYSPDGNYSEGSSYWGYGTIYQALLNSCLDSTLGADFGLSSVKGFDKTAEYVILTYGSTWKPFNYSDCPETTISQPGLWYFANRFRDPSLLFTELKFLETDNYADNDNSRLLPLFIYWAQGVRTDGTATPARMYTGQGANPVAMFRGDWNDSSNDWYLGIKAGTAKHNHGHMDSGTFVFDAFGTRWAADLGSANYAETELKLQATGGNFWEMDQQSQRWDIFPLGNEWHNTLTINGKRHVVEGKAEILETYAENGLHGATMNLTPMFTDAVHASRTIVTDGSSLTVTDSLKTIGKSTVCWTLVSDADASAEHGRVLLRAGGTTMELTSSATDACYSLREPGDLNFRGKSVIDIKFSIPKDMETVTVTSLKPVYNE